MLELIGLIVSLFGWSLAALGWSSYIATFALTVALSVAGATLTFFMIEQPMIRFGYRIAEALVKRRMLTASDSPAVVSQASE